MAIVYYNLPGGGNRQVNETVMVGSHDAAITSGGIRTQTQDQSITDQALCGVRIFDIRISGQRTGSSGAKLSAFHGSNTPSTKSKVVGGVTQNIAVTRMVGGEWGLDLDEILDQSMAFFKQCPSEFLILKFDKSSNYEMILQACQTKLGRRLYTAKGNIANKTLADMAGKVVCGFMGDGYKELARAGKGIDDGVARIANLYSENKPDDIDGLMYYGKGGTSIAQPTKYAFNGPVKGKHQQNIDRQFALMTDATYQTPDVLRMMYWTQTGVVRGIKSRDKIGWTTGAKARMKQLWADGAYPYLQGQVPEAYSMDSLSTNFEIHLPNFIMIDFADEDKGQTIYDLNLLTRNEIVQLNASLAPDQDIDLE